MKAALYKRVSACRWCGWSIYGGIVVRISFRLRHSFGHLLQSLGFHPGWAKTMIDATAAIKWDLLYGIADPAHTMTKAQLLRYVAVEASDLKNATLTLLWVNAVLIPVLESYPSMEDL